MEKESNNEINSQDENNEIIVDEENESISTDNTLVVKEGGLIITLIFITLFLILIGLFYWWSSLSNVPVTPKITPERPTAEVNKEPESTTARAQTDSFNAMSTSDELTAIEADLESTNLNSLDSEITAIEAELEAVN